MSKQPEALRLADALHSNDTQGLMSQAAAELRRLHAANAELAEALEGVMEGCEYKTLQGESAWHTKSMPSNAALDAGRAALSKHKEQQG